MLQISGPEEHFGKVLMPSECLHRFRTSCSTDQRSREFADSDYFWGITIQQSAQSGGGLRRKAHLITRSEVPGYVKKGVKSVVPAYRRPQSDSA